MPRPHNYSLASSLAYCAWHVEIPPELKAEQQYQHVQQGLLACTGSTARAHHWLIFTYLLCFGCKTANLTNQAVKYRWSQGPTVFKVFARKKLPPSPPSSRLAAHRCGYSGLAGTAGGTAAGPPACTPRSTLQYQTASGPLAAGK